MLKKILFFSLILQPLFIFCQVVDSPKLDENGQQEGSSSILGNASLSTPAAPFMPPRIALRTYKLTANIAGGWWDFYFLNNVPTFTVKAQDTVSAFSNEILNQIGGVLNVSLSKIGFFANGHDDVNKDVKGGQIDFRAGAKLVDPPTRSYDQFIVPTFQTSLDVRYLIPLSKGKVQDKAELKKNMVGNLSFRVYGTYQRIFNSDAYRDYFFITPKGNILVEPNIFTYNYEINLFITNAIYISFGQSFSNIYQIKNRTIFSLSYSAPSK